MPLPLTTEQRIGQVLQVFPALSRRIIAPTGGEQMQMGMVVPIATMRMGHHDVATSERLAPDLAKKVIHALHPAAHQCTQQEPGILIEGRAEHGWDGENDVAIDHPFMQYLAHLVDTG